jgi:hypothetical protein
VDVGCGEERLRTLQICEKTEDCRDTTAIPTKRFEDRFEARRNGIVETGGSGTRRSQDAKREGVSKRREVSNGRMCRNAAGDWEGEGRFSR